MTRATGQRRGYCADCGANCELTSEGNLPDHKVKRVGFDGKVYASDEGADAHCSGAGKGPQYLPTRHPLKRASAKILGEREDRARARRGGRAA